MRNAVRIILVALFSVSCMTGTLLFGQEDIDRYIERGPRFEREGNLDEAVKSYEEVISRDPENVMIRIRLAKILSWQNEFDRARVMLEEVLERVPDSEEALFRKAQIKSWKGEYEESIELYRRFLDLKKNYPNGMFGLARVLFWSGRYDEAIQYFEKALSSDADEVEVRIELGKVYLASNDRKKAKEEFEKVLAMDPKNRELEYMEHNDLFIKAVYGGDVETRDPVRRVFDFATGISVSLTDQIETSLSFAWVETLYGRSSEISWSS